jgi:predicted PurR-regulated permease PerM
VARSQQHPAPVAPQVADGHQASPGPARPGDAVPGWLRLTAGLSWRAVVTVGALALLVYALTKLALVFLPIFIAILISTLLYPVVRFLRRRGAPPALAAAATMLGLVALLAVVIALIAPSIAGQFTDLGDQLRQGTTQVTGYLSDHFGISRGDIDRRVEQTLNRARQNSGEIGARVLSGAALVGEALTGVILTVLLTFFFLKDGGRIWGWLTSLLGPRARPHAEELGRRSFTALGGYVHGIAFVGLVDAVLIGLALLIIGVPLVVPLMILTFLAAFFPLVGAVLAGLAAALIALVAKGVVAALLVVGAILLVQQVEGHLLYPLVVGRSVQLHPVAIILALAVGGVLAGIVGAFLAVPVASLIAVAIDYARGQPPPPPPPKAGAVAAPEARAAT